MRTDQAEGLRRLFGSAGPRVLPVLLDEPPGAEAVATLAALLQALARRGERVLACDGTRAGLAARFGLRARFDLLHALQGDRPIERVRLPAGDGLHVVPAARALAAALEARVTLEALAPAWADLKPGCDLLVPVLQARHAPLLAPRPGAHAPFVVLAIAAAAGGAAPLAARLAAFHRPADIGVFRLLFPGMDAPALATLATGLTASARRARLPVEVPTSITLASARDPARVAAAIAGWQLPVLRSPQVAVAEEKAA